MKQTPNYNLNKPDANDMFSLEHWNENSDKIDEALTPEFEDYTGATTVPNATTALSGIKSRTKISTLFQNIKAFCKGCCTLGMLVNNCVTDNANLPLAASQGKALMDQIASLNGRIEGLHIIQANTIDEINRNITIPYATFGITYFKDNNAKPYATAYLSIDFEWIRLQFKVTYNSTQCRTIYGQSTPLEWKDIYQII